MVYYINGNRMKRLQSVLLSPKDASDRQSLPQFKPKMIKPHNSEPHARGKAGAVLRLLYFFACLLFV
jgi:hypothetical protein